MGTVKGFATTFKALLGRAITEQYPEYKHPVMPRFRGRHRLHVHPNGLEKCVGCSLCAAACPADCIRVVAAENTDTHRVSAGERYAAIYEINMTRCIFCGYCEMACPFDAITLGNDWELADINRDEMIYTKQMLLDPPPAERSAPTREGEGLDSPLPIWLEQAAAAERGTTSGGGGA
jgi:NADH-quinone oxidoreductase subunit I